MTGRNKWARWLALGLSFGLSIWIGLGVSDSIPGGTVDFQVVYYAARCLASHRDPYLLNELKATYIEEARKLPAGDIDRPQAVTWLIYPPTMFPLVAPFLLLGWNTARWVWTLLLIAGLFASTILILQTRPRAAPMVSLILLCILLANSEVVIGGGNTAGLAVALGVLGIWCVIEERWVTTGVFLLALSLLLKPHDAGLVWCFLLLAGGAVRKRALQTLMVVVVLGTLSLAWVGRTAPNWPSEWKSNLHSISTNGNTSDPGAISEEGRHVVGTLISLQAVIAAFGADARVYNGVTYGICGVLFLAVAWPTLRRRLTADQLWLGLAAVVPLTLLITYHRPYDARLMMLTVPGCCMMVARGGWRGRVALVLTACAIAASGDLTAAILDSVLDTLHATPASIAGRILIVLFTRTASLALLAMSVFYVAVYVRDSGQGTLAAYDSRRTEAETAF